MINSTPILSKYFTWEDVTRSSTAERLGIDNSIPYELRTNAVRTAYKADAVREALANPMYVDSWYRSQELNAVLNSKETSDHRKAMAVDFVCPAFGTPVEICQFLLHYVDKLKWKQLILEHTWVHISFYETSIEENRYGEVLTLLSGGGYAYGLTDIYGKKL